METEKKKNQKKPEEQKKQEPEKKTNADIEAQIIKDAQKAMELNKKMMEDRAKILETAGKMAREGSQKSQWQEFRMIDPDFEKFKILIQRIDRLEKQGKSAWKRQLLASMISALVGVIVGGILTTILFPRIDKWLATQSLKPNKDRCAIVFLKDDPYSKEIALIAKEVLDSADIEPINQFRLVAKDSVWYSKFYTGEAESNKCIELSYNHPTNKWLVDASKSPTPAPVHDIMKAAIFVKDNTGRGIRDTTLPLSRPELKWIVKDVRPRGQMPPEAGLKRNAISVVSPPSSWWKEK